MNMLVVIHTKSTIISQVQSYQNNYDLLHLEYCSGSNTHFLFYFLVFIYIQVFLRSNHIMFLALLYLQFSIPALQGTPIGPTNGVTTKD
jgi:hypothetical protein